MRRPLLATAVALALYLVARLVLADDALVDRVANVLAFAIASGGCVAAAFAFERGDYLRTAWYLQGASYAILVASAAIQRPGLEHGIMVGRVGLIFIANVLGVAGTLLFARAHRVAGLELPWSRRNRVLFMVVVAVLAIAAAGPPLVLQVGPALRGDLAAASGAISSLGDLVTLALIAPLFMTAVALRGGLLVWPWAFYTAATVAWLVYDAQDTVFWLLPSVGEERLAAPTVALRILACTLTFAAGLAQRRLSTGGERVDSGGRPG